MEKSGDVLVFFLNGEKVEVERPDPAQSLADYLRGEGFTGTKVGCGRGLCGACTVMLSTHDPLTKQVTHRSINACLAPLCSIDHAAVTTIEGLGNTRAPGAAHPIQERFTLAHASQCGFCTPGMVMAFYALLRSHPDGLTEEDVKANIDGNLCRCTGYRPILDAMRTFAKNTECAKQEVTKDENGYVVTHSLGLDGATYHPLNLTSEPIFPPFLMTHPPRSAHYVGDTIDWYKPTTLKEALALKAKHPEAQILAGNTRLVNKKLQPTVVISVGLIPELKAVAFTDAGLDVGAAVTLTTLRDSLVAAVATQDEGKTAGFAALAEQVKWIGGTQVRNSATVGGSLVAGHIWGGQEASDLIPVLVVLGATVTVAAGSGDRRSVPVSAFVKGGGKVDLQPDELILSIPGRARRVLQAVRPPDEQRLPGHGRVSLAPGRERRRLGHQVGHHLPGRRKPQARPIGRQDGGLPGREEPAGPPFGPADRLRSPGRGLPRRGRGRRVQARRHQRHILQILQQGGGAREQRGGPVRALPIARHAGPAALRRARVLQGGGPPDQAHHLPHPVLRRSPVRGRHASSEDALRDDGAGHEGARAGGEHRRVARTRPPRRARLLLGQGRARQRRRTLQGRSAVRGGRGAVLRAAAGHRGGRHPGARLPRRPPRQGRIRGPAGHHHHRRRDQGGQLLRDVAHVPRPRGAGQRGGGAEAGRHRRRGRVQPRRRPSLVHGAALVSGGAQGRRRPFDPLHRAGRGPRAGGGGVRVEHAPEGRRRAGEARGRRFRWQGHPILHVLRRRSRRQAPQQAGEAHAGPRHGLAGGWYACALPLQVQGGSHLRRQDHRRRLPGVRERRRGDRSVVLDSGRDHQPPGQLLQRAPLPRRRQRSNIAPTKPYRGAGIPQGIVAGEFSLDHVARKLGLAPHIVRELNFYQQGEVTLAGQHLDECSLGAVWHACRQQSDFDRRFKEAHAFNQHSTYTKRGVATMPIKQGVGIGGAMAVWAKACALVHILSDGTVIVNHGGVEMGQGLNIKIAQLAAETLGVPLDTVHVPPTSNEVLQHGGATGGSFTFELNGSAACEELNARLAPLKEAMAGKAWKEVVQAALFSRVCLSSYGWHAVDFEDRKFLYYAWGTAFAEVELDVLTGSYRVLRVDVVQDVGTSINPAVDVGQVEGAFVQGVGWLTSEELKWDAQGRVDHNYEIPTPESIPIEFHVNLLKGPNARGLLSSKGIGEPPKSMSATVALAIKDAIVAARTQAGLSSDDLVLDLPLTVERVRLACGDLGLEHTLETTTTTRK